MTKRKGREDAEERHLRPSSCVGCGQAASGYNYDAPSCYACKTFFRRIVIKKRVFRGCIRDGHCANDADRQCRACRFEMCVKGGMNASRVNMNSPELEREESSLKEPSSSNSTCHSTLNESEDGRGAMSSTKSKSQHTNTELRLVGNPSRFETKVEKMIGDLLTIEIAHHMLRVSIYMPKIDCKSTLDEFVAGPSKLGNNFAVMCTYQPFPTPLYPLEIIVQGFPMDLPRFDYSKKKLWFIHDIVYSIEFIKALPIYHLLETQSKKVLLSSALTCANFTSAFYSYSQRSDRTSYPDGATYTWNSEIQEQAPNSTRLHTVIIASMREVDLNTHEYTLLKMIAVCNPMLDGLNSPDVTLLRHEKEQCNKVLLSYVLARRGVKEGPACFIKLLSIANLVMQLTAWEKDKHILARAMGLYGNSPFGEAIFHSH